MNHPNTVSFFLFFFNCILVILIFFWWVFVFLFVFTYVSCTTMSTFMQLCQLIFILKTGMAFLKLLIHIAK